MEIVEPRKIYENLAVRICALNTDQVSESTDIFQTQILYKNTFLITNIPKQAHNLYTIYPLY